jgi:hypothetical protein
MYIELKKYQDSLQRTYDSLIKFLENNRTDSDPTNRA